MTDAAAENTLVLNLDTGPVRIRLRPDLAALGKAGIVSAGSGYCCPLYSSRAI